MGEEWAFILDEKEIEEKVPVTAKVGKRTVMLYKTGTKIYAVSGKCPHYGAPLHKGVARKGTVICPWHHARFDIETGRLIAPPALKDLEYYDVKVEKSRYGCERRCGRNLKRLPARKTSCSRSSGLERPGPHARSH